MAYRQKLAADDLQALGHEISACVITLLQTFKPCTVGLFHPTQGEPEILCVAEAPGLSSFSWALPVCCESPTGPILQFAGFRTGEQLEVGRYKIPVPAEKNWVHPGVLLIPCVGFHRGGARLGYGAGWYDRTLSRFTQAPISIGVAYAATESPDNFAENHDHLLDFVVTEKEVIHCHPGKFQ